MADDIMARIHEIIDWYYEGIITQTEAFNMIADAVKWQNKDGKELFRIGSYC